MRATFVGLLIFFPQAALVAAAGKGHHQRTLELFDARHRGKATWQPHGSGGYCSTGWVGGLRLASPGSCETACKAKDECQFYCHGFILGHPDCLHYSECTSLRTVLPKGKASDYSCYRRPELANTSSSSAVVVDAGSVTAFSSALARRQSPAEQPVDLPTIRSYILQIDDVCDQVDEALGEANGTLYNLTETMAPLAEEALSMLGNAKSASAAADMFGATGVATWITQFSDKMTAKVVDFQTRMHDASLGMLDQLVKAHDEIALIRTNVMDKFDSAFTQLEALVQAIVNASKSESAAVAAVGGSSTSFMSRSPKALGAANGTLYNLTETNAPVFVLSILGNSHSASAAAGMGLVTLLSDKTTAKEKPLVPTGANFGLHRIVANFSKTDIVLARDKFLRGNASANGLVEINKGTIDNVRAALDQAKTTLEPLKAALSQLSDMIADGLVGQVLNQVQDGVSTLNQSAFDAVETAGSALPAVMKDQMQGIFNGAMSMVDKVSAQIPAVVEQITGKLNVANETEVKLEEAIDMMMSLLDSVAPIAENSFAARLPSYGASLLLAFGLAVGSAFQP